jgi:hypothetical protein
LRAGEAAGRDRNRPRADRFAAGDVVRSVPDHIHLRRGEIDRVFFSRTRLRETPQFIAIMMIVSKRPELEKPPKPVMSQLQFRPAFHVAGQKTKHILRARLEPVEQLPHAWQNPSIALRKLAGQKFHIEIEEGRGRLFIHRNVLLAQNLVHDPGISFARDLDSMQIVGNPKLLFQHILERLETRAPGIDQRPVDIEEKKALGNR